MTPSCKWPSCQAVANKNSHHKKTVENAKTTKPSVRILQVCPVYLLLNTNISVLRNSLQTIKLSVVENRRSWEGIPPYMTNLLGRHGSTPVSTVLQKSVTFFILNIFLIIKNTFQVEILSEWLGNPGKGILRSQNPLKRPEGTRPRNRQEACAFGARLGNRSVFILDPRLLGISIELRTAQPLVGL